MRAGSVLMVSAFAPELAPLERWLAEPTRRGRWPRSGVSCVPVGIGAVDAAAGAAIAIERHAARLVVFVGTAGSYGAAPAIGAVAIAHRLHLVSPAVATGRAYFPGPMCRLASTDAPLRRALLRAAGPAHEIADIATPLAITSTRALASALAAPTAATLENLEVFAVARAAAHAGVPFGAILGVANRVGPDAHRQWTRHQAEATVAACAVATAWLESRPRA